MLNKSNRIPLTYKDRPVVGLDIGTKTVKLIQLKKLRGGSKVVAYGEADYPVDSIVEGIIVDPQLIADVVKPVLSKPKYGRFTARRVAASLPTDKVFIRVVNLPSMEEVELEPAIMLEAEQYVPVPIAHLYVDYEIITKSPEGCVVLMVAAPSAIVDSYVQLFDLLELEPALVEPDILAAARAVAPYVKVGQAALVVDIESESTSIAIYDRDVRVTNTISLGGDNVTTQMVKKLGLTKEQAEEIKVKFGLGESGLHDKIVAAIKPTLDTMAQEFNRMIHYYADHGGQDNPVAAVLLAGGTSQLPGLSETLSDTIKLPISTPNPWTGLKLGYGVKLPEAKDLGAYTTAIGLARLGAKL
jgi:type IV pilus assembly protein PilM